MKVLLELPGINRQRRPVAFVRCDRFAKNRQIPRTNAWATVPNLAVEVVSRSNTFDRIAEKAEEYFQVGLSQVSVILREQVRIDVYTSPKNIRVLDRNDDLDGDNVLPGFKLPLAVLSPGDRE